MVTWKLWTVAYFLLTIVSICVDPRLKISSCSFVASVLEFSALSASSAVKIKMAEGEQLNRITEQIIGSAMDVHRALGPGLLESAYEACLMFELVSRGLKAEQQRALPVVYRDVKLDCGYRLDLVVENSVVIELKAVDQLLPIHRAQLLSYLKLSGLKVGLLINFHTKMLKDGVVRLVNKF